MKLFTPAIYKHKLESCPAGTHRVHSSLHRIELPLGLSTYWQVVCVDTWVGVCVYAWIRRAIKKKGLLSYEMVEFSFCFWGGKYYTLPRFFFFFSPPITLIWVYNFWIFSFEESLVHFLSLYFNHSWINICWINWFFWKRSPKNLSKLQYHLLQIKWSLSCKSCSKTEYWWDEFFNQVLVGQTCI